MFHDTGATMGFDLIRVCVFGRNNPDWCNQIRLGNATSVEAVGFDIHAFVDDSDLMQILVDIRPQVIVSFGQPESYRQLWAAPLEIRRRWVNFETPDIDPAAVADRIMATFIENAMVDRFPEEPLISVFTPTHLTGAKIERPLQSLLAQRYANWEWVVYDDSPDDGRTFEQMSELAQRDHRITAYRADRAIGCIGEVK